MAQQMMSIWRNRFWNNTVSELQEANRSPVFGYRHLPIMSLEEAVKNIDPFVPHIERYVEKAKKLCRKNTTLTINESAAIYLYTMPDCCFYDRLNEACRTGNRYTLELWSPFLKLFITALVKLPSCSIMVWRGVGDISGIDFNENDLHTWWSVNSCSSRVNVAGIFAGETGTLFCINAIHAKDITAYSANQSEEEMVLMPGTSLRVKCTRFETKNLSIVHLEECTTIPEGKHVMLSYHPNSQKIVSEICQFLQDEHIPVWFEERRDLDHNIHNSMADGVENAAIVCCFLTPDYENSEDCKLELQYAQKRHRIIIPCLFSDTKFWKIPDWLERITTDLIPLDFHDISESTVRSTANQLIDRIREQSWAPQYLPSRAFDRPSYLFELIRQKYQQNSCIERIIDPSKSFPIEQSYINLAIVKAKEQHEKEKQLRDGQHGNTIIGAFEEIYGMKTAINIKDMFNTCKNHKKQVLVFGRAGIGKSTLCRYIAYQWATGSYWPQYELLALILLRRLTADRYPPLSSDQNYSLVDLVKKEVFTFDLSEKDCMFLKNQFDARKTLWILDGYDEVVQNVPPHLECLFEQLLKTPHHILTSRPYMNTLSYDVQMEITGFTDKNIEGYMQQFFGQMKDEIDDALMKSQKLLSFLKSNQSIWGVAHIPINLELICSCWSNEDWSETKRLTITVLYSMMTEWICRRYLTPQNKQIQQLSKGDVDQLCQKELAFLESLAFNAMKSNTIILRPPLLEKAFSEAGISLKDQPNILNIGVLKTFTRQGIGNQIETNKDHYFIHLSFQEYFAARYLINTLNDSSNQKAIEFIKHQKYNQRYALVFIFASGLLNENDEKPCINNFWNIVTGEPLDLVGIRHIQLLISCLEETIDKSTLPWYIQFLERIVKCINYSICTKNKVICWHLSQSLQRAQSITSDQIIINAFIGLLQYDDGDIKSEVLSIISTLDISNPLSLLITSMVNAVGDENEDVRKNACYALGSIGERAGTNEVISKLVTALEDKNPGVRWNTYYALGNIGERAGTNEVISKLLSTLGNEDEHARWKACEALEHIGGKAGTNEMISKLLSALGDENKNVRCNACEALEHIGEKAGTNAVISKLVVALGDENENVRCKACKALGSIGEKAGTNEAISKLVSALRDVNGTVRWSACEALGSIGEKAGTKEVISKLLSALGDENEDVRMYACEALGEIGEKAGTNEMVSKLVTALGDEDEDVRWNACYALGRIGEKAGTNEMISKLVTALGDENENVRWNASRALGSIGEKAGTNEVISKLVTALGDENEDVRTTACYALGKIGERAGTNKVISKLVTALGDENENVRWSACRALGKIGEKAGTNEVISKLVGALEDENEDVRKNACKALGNIGEMAGTNEVISKLVIVLEDENENVRCKACKALGSIGGKAGTNEVISKLVIVLEDENENVRCKACKALGSIGEKAGTNEVISKLVSALEDENKDVRMNACYALGSIGEKAGTNEVISKLVSALEDENNDVIMNACYALGKMGEKAGTNEVISKLLLLLTSGRYWKPIDPIDAIKNILSSLAVTTQLSPQVIVDLCLCNYGSACLENVSVDQLIIFFLTTLNTDWLPAVTEFALLKGIAVIATEHKVVVYGKKEPVELQVRKLELYQQLIKALTDRTERLHLYSKVPYEAENKSHTSFRTCSIS